MSAATARALFASALPVSLVGSCPACGTPVRLAPLSRGVVCGRCGAASVFVPPRGGPALTLADAVERTDDALALVPRACPGDKSPTRAVSHLPFLAPYWHFTARLYEAVGGTERRGALAVRGAVKTVPIVADAAAVPLPPSAHATAPLPLLSFEALLPRRRLVLPACRASSRLEDAARRLSPVRLVRDVVPFVREGRLWEDQRLLVLKPFHLLEVDDGPSRRDALVDGAARGWVRDLSPEEARALRHALVEWDPSGPRVAPALSLLRCPGCGASLGRDASAAVAFCGSCGTASHATERGQRPIPYQVAGLPRAPLPYWRLRFRLGAGDDAATSLAEVKARLRGRECPAPRGEAADAFLDVPAFARERPARTTSTAAASTAGAHLPEASPGPLARGRGYLRPRRAVAIEADEAAFAARHALLSALRPAELEAAGSARIRELLFGAPLETSGAELVLRDA